MQSELKKKMVLREIDFYMIRAAINSRSDPECCVIIVENEE